jgi:SSS family solute:Na+ symporter
MTSTVVFLIMFIIFAAILVGMGIYSRKWVSDSSDYILAGREISTPVNMMGISAIGFAGTSIALAPGFTVLNGFKASFLWSFIYTVCGLLFFALIYAKFIRRCGSQTLPEYLEMRYDGTVRSVVSITSVIGMAGILANNIVSCANTISGYTGWDSMVVIGVIFLIIISFTFISGLWATTLTDFFQVAIGTIAIPLLILLLLRRYGGFEAINANWMNNNFVQNGISGLAIKGTALTYPSILNFVVLFAAALVWGNNYYWMKIANCRSEKVARNSFILATIVLLVIFLIPLGLIGAFAGAFMKDKFVLAGLGGKLIHTGAYGLIASTFVPILGSFFVIGAVAASISTASTAALGATAVGTRDIYQRLINKNADPKKTLIASKIIMVLIGILTWGICLLPGGPTYIFAFANCWLVPPAILLGLGAFWPRFNTRGALWGAVAGMSSMFVLTLLGDILKIFMINNYIYLATLGFLITLVVAVGASLTEKPKYYGASSWERIPTETNREKIELTDFDTKILEMIRVGHCYMSDLTDAMGVDSKISGASIERLDRGGYIVREGLSGSKFYSFSITDKGIAALPKLIGMDETLAKVNLTTLYVELLKVAEKGAVEQAAFVKNNGIKSMRMSSICSHLTRQGYVIERGMYKRRLEVTDKGKQIIKSTLKNDQAI